MATVRKAVPADAAAIAAIYSQGIEDRSATFETEPRRAGNMLPKIAEQERFPVLVAVDEAARVLGWAGLSSYRSRDCYRGIAEFSIYLDRQVRDRGIGKQLLDALIEAAKATGQWKPCPRSSPSTSPAGRSAARAASARSASTKSTVSSMARWLDTVIVEQLIPENLATTLEDSP